MRERVIAAGAVSLALLLAGTARAEPAVYTWSGMGTNVPGSAKCSTYRLTIEVTVDGKSIKGVVKQQGRPERTFQTTTDASGAFNAKVQLADDNAMDVSGTLSSGGGRVLLDGYCKFEGKLTPK